MQIPYHTPTPWHPSQAEFVRAQSYDCVRLSAAAYHHPIVTNVSRRKLVNYWSVIDNYSLLNS